MNNRFRYWKFNAEKQCWHIYEANDTFIWEQLDEPDTFMYGSVDLNGNAIWGLTQEKKFDSVEEAKRYLEELPISAYYWPG